MDGVEYQIVSRWSAMKCVSSLGLFPRLSETRYNVAPCLIVR